jgi:hypothetical protein
MLWAPVELLYLHACEEEDIWTDCEARLLDADCV